MKKVILGCFLVISLYGWGNTENFIKGSTDWEQFDNGNEKVDKFFAYGYLNYIGGVMDAIDDILVCRPKNSTGNQVLAIVRKYIKENPEKWNKSAWYLVYTPLTKAFPCKKQKDKK